MPLDVAGADILSEVLYFIGCLHPDPAGGDDSPLSRSKDDPWKDGHIGGEALEHASAVKGAFVLAVSKLPAADIYGFGPIVIDSDVFLVRLISVTGIARAEGDVFGFVGCAGRDVGITSTVVGIGQETVSVRINDCPPIFSRRNEVNKGNYGQNQNTGSYSRTFLETVIHGHILPC